jgi:hypothetical protein
MTLAGFPLGCGSATNGPDSRLVRVTPDVTFSLEDGEQYHRNAPDTFEIPPRFERENLRPGQIVKLMFNITVGRESTVERMWAIVEAKDGTAYVGALDNQPATTDQMRPGMKVRFEPKHVISIYPERADDKPASS